MSTTHNIDYYQNLYQNYSAYKENAIQRDRFHSYIAPHYSLASYLSSALEKRISSEFIKSVYSTTGNGMVNISGFFSPDLASWTESLWFDPIDNKTLLKIGRKIQSLSFPLATRTATRLPILGVLDRCLIAAARHAYIVSKDLNNLLSIPERLHYLIDEGISEMTSDSLAGKSWYWIKTRVEKIFILIGQVTYRSFCLFKNIFKRLPLIESAIVGLENYFESSKNYFGETLSNGIAYLKGRVVEKAHQIIEDKESKIRRKVVGTVAAIAAKKAIRVVTTFALTTSFTYLIYKGSKSLPSISWIPQNTYETARKISAVTLWVFSIAPIFYRFQSHYKDNFDSDASTLRELNRLLYKHNLYSVYKLIKSI